MVGATFVVWALRRRRQRQRRPHSTDVGFNQLSDAGDPALLLESPTLTDESSGAAVKGGGVAVQKMLMRCGPSAVRVNPCAMPGGGVE